MKDVIDSIRLLDVGKIEENVSLKKYTTYRAGGNASCIVYPKNTDCLITLMRFLQKMMRINLSG